MFFLLLVLSSCSWADDSAGYTRISVVPSTQAPPAQSAQAPAGQAAASAQPVIPAGPAGQGPGVHPQAVAPAPAASAPSPGAVDQAAADKGYQEMLKQAELIQQKLNPPAPKPSVVPDASNEDLPGEVIQAQEGIRKAYSAINDANPMSENFGKSANGQAAPASPEIERIQKLLNNPIVQRYLGLFQDTKFIDHLSSLAEHPNLKILGWSQLALILLMLFFRAWKLSKVASFGQRLWISFYTFVIFTVTSVGILPGAILGDAYFSVVGRIYAEMKQPAPVTKPAGVKGG